MVGRPGSRTHFRAAQVRTGQIDVNGGAFNPLAPFGGYKQSGVGREMPGSSPQPASNPTTLATPLDRHTPARSRWRPWPGSPT
ncbi:aldehyde dehydrogenase family protein [Streptomyces sp. NPDC087532]|uniref:aldehyde dehydrogenase family protein n=1 Tax=unclassified Streptomyces TaxID=2593676 RepID=UPI00332FA29C